MKKIVLFIQIMMISFIVNAQKAKIEYDSKTNKVSVNGVESFKMERFDCGFGMLDCHFDVFDKDGKKVIRINYRDFKSPVEVSKYNPEGNVQYYEFIFLESKQKAEINYVGITVEKVAKSIISNNLIVDGKLDVAAVDEFILSNGTPFSERVKF